MKHLHLIFFAIIFFIANSSAQTETNFTFNNTPYQFTIIENEEDLKKASFKITTLSESKYEFIPQNLAGNLKLDSQNVYFLQNKLYISINDDTLRVNSLSVNDTMWSVHDNAVRIVENKDLSDSFHITKVLKIEEKVNNSHGSKFEFDKSITENDFRYLFEFTINKHLAENVKIDSLIKIVDLKNDYNDLVFRLWYFCKNYFNQKELQVNIEAIENEELVEAGILELVGITIKAKHLPINKDTTEITLKKGEKLDIKLKGRNIFIDDIIEDKKTKKDSVKIKLYYEEVSAIDFEVKKVEVEIVKNQVGLTIIGNAGSGLDKKEIIIEFNNWDVYLSNANLDIQSNTFNYKGEKYIISVGDILKYYGPADGKANPNVKNCSFALTPENPKETLYKRAFTDFVSGVIFTDLLSSRAQKPNKFLQTEIMLNFPLNHKNRKRLIWINELYGAITYSQISDDDPQLDLNKGTDGIYRADFMDFIRYNTIQTKFRLNLLRIQNKKIQGNMYFDVGFDMFSSISRYFTGIEKVGADSTANYNSFLINKISPQASFRLEAFPTSKVGLMFDVSYGQFYKQNTINKDGIDYRISPTDRIKYDKDGGSSIIDSRVSHLFVYSLNAFYLLNPEKGAAGGIFARVRIFQDVHAEEIYPQLLIGYGVNISSLMK
jgi:hypothetical protein